VSRIRSTPPATMTFADAALKAAGGSYFPALLTATVSLFFALFAFYGLAGAQVAPRPPLLRTGLIAIGVIYTLRDLLLALGSWQAWPDLRTAR